jgi:hypothetical protein
MLDILRDYISQNATPEMLATLEVAFLTFERIGLEDYERQYEEILMIADDDELNAGVDTMSAVVTLTKELQRKILREHGIFLMPEVTVEFLDQTISTLLDVQEREVTDELTSVLAMEGRPEELFAELMALFTPLVADEILLHLFSVEAFAITRLRDMLEAKQTQDVVDEALVAHNVEMLTKFAKVAKSLETLKFYKSGMPPGVPFVNYINWLGHELEQMPVDKVALELLGMALASSDGVDNPRGVIKEHIDRYISNLDSITKIDVVVTDTLLKINQL